MFSKVKKNATVLIVEDSPVIGLILEDVVRFAGYNCSGLLDHGKGLLNAIRFRQPDVLLLDVHLPDANGMDLLTEVRRAHPKIAVIMITLECNPDIERRAKQLGAGFIQKPFTAEQIGVAIEGALAKMGKAT